MLKLCDEQILKTRVIASFPATFKLRAYKGIFRVGYNESYVNDSGELMLYTQIRRNSDPARKGLDVSEWIDHTKGTEAELRAQIVLI